ncbi:MAG: DUF2087 domain-containing protein [Nanoarchaeota archaeon]|nr:DUF2087 domain-containing protein [Nanoarchaeota archaeon]
MQPVEFPFETEQVYKDATQTQTLPENEFVKQAVLVRVMRDFGDGQKYFEPQVDELIKPHFSDTAAIRKELINYGYISRNPLTSTEYWVIKRCLTMYDVKNNTILRRNAKQYHILPEDG